MFKQYNTISLSQFTNNITQFLNLPGANGKLEIFLPVLFEQLNESKQFWGTFFDNVSINGNYLKNAK